MSVESFRFKVGSIECIVVGDGSFTYPDPVHLFFANAPAEQAGQALREHDIQPEQWVQYVSPYSCLVVNTGRNRVLVDTGGGNLLPTTGKLIENLRAEGIAPGDIDTVILTHAHPDHIGGNTDARGMVALPNARHVIWRSEWQFWLARPGLAELGVPDHLKELLATIAHDKLVAIQDRVDLVETETEVVPGVRVLSVPGHTPGQVAVVIASGGAQLLHLSDVLIHPIHAEHPDWHAAVDCAPQQVVAARHQLLARAAAEEMLVFAMHFAPFPSLGRIVRAGEAWRWQPIAATS